MASAKNTAKNTVKASKTEEKVQTPSEIRATLISEGFDGISVDSMMPLLGIAFHDISALRLVLTNAKIAAENAVKAAKEEIAKKKGQRAERAANDQAALMQVFNSIGIKSVPEMMNDVRDEKRFSLKVLEKNGPKVKVHDRDLVGLRFTSGRFNLCFQLELPFERTTGTEKFSFNPTYEKNDEGVMIAASPEHAKEKENILGQIAKVILSNYSPEGVYIGG